MFITLIALPIVGGLAGMTAGLAIASAVPVMKKGIMIGALALGVAGIRIGALVGADHGGHLRLVADQDDVAEPLG